MADYDAIRAAHPELAISLYGLTPGGDVVLEVIDPEGGTFSWTGPTSAAVLAMAFPPDPPAEPEPVSVAEEHFTPFAEEVVRKHTPAAPPNIFD